MCDARHGHLDAQSMQLERQNSEKNLVFFVQHILKKIRKEGNAISKNERLSILSLLANKIENMRKTTTHTPPVSLPEYWLLRQG